LSYQGYSGDQVITIIRVIRVIGVVRAIRVIRVIRVTPVTRLSAKEAKKTASWGSDSHCSTDIDSPASKVRGWNGRPDDAGEGSEEGSDVAHRQRSTEGARPER
jgi:hypothetical protein